MLPSSIFVAQKNYGGTYSHLDLTTPSWSFHAETDVVPALVGPYVT